jgi:hypothetical protein
MRKVKAYGSVFLMVLSLKLMLDAHGANIIWGALLLAFWAKQTYERRYDLGVIAGRRKAS